MTIDPTSNKSAAPEPLEPPKAKRVNFDDRVFFSRFGETDAKERLEGLVIQDRKVLVLINKTAHGVKVFALGPDGNLRSATSPHLESREELNAFCQKMFTLDPRSFVLEEYVSLPHTILQSISLMLRESEKSPLSDAQRAEITKQIKTSQAYLDEHRDELIERAKKSSEGAVYIRPQDQEATKLGKSKYTACHLQVCEDGTVYMIPKHDLLSLGKGSFKSVRLAFREADGKFVAAASAKSSRPESLLNEYLFLKQFEKVLAFTFYTKEGGVQKGKLIMPFAKYGDIFDYVQDSKRVPISQVELGLKIIQAVKPLHAAGIVHNDVKPENFLISQEEGQVVVWMCDFGFARRREDCAQSPIDGTAKYLPYETLFNRHSLEKRDIYSLGVTLFFLFLPPQFQARMRGPLPWLNSVRAGADYPQLYDNYMKLTSNPDPIPNLLARMTHPDPDQRPTIEEVERDYRACLKL
ncbi:MAG: protein kinase family protein [Chlamydiia bacterium]|nr:protein kinase family protein [Chlamydiia bacterium]